MQAGYDSILATFSVITYANALISQLGQMGGGGCSVAVHVPLSDRGMGEAGQGHFFF